MIPPDIAATLREALDNLREHKGKYTRIDSKTLKWEPDTSALAAIDAALVYLDTLPAAPAPYSHRNGETEPPTVAGWYWFKGSVSVGNHLGFSVHFDVVRLDDSQLVAFPNDYMATLRNVTGRWWGPIVPPFEATE